MLTTASKARGVTAHDIVKFTLTREQFVLINKYAITACVGGVSRIHTDPKTRMAKLLTDNVAGMTGNLLGNYHLDRNYNAYVASREQADKNRHKGDGGQDRPGCGLDFKCSFMRAGADPLNYSMLVRPKERHENWVYVQFLIGAPDLASFKLNTPIYLVGWAEESDLPDKVETYGPFEGTFRIPVRDLRPITPFPEFLTGLN